MDAFDEAKLKAGRREIEVTDEQGEAEKEDSRRLAFDLLGECSEFILLAAKPAEGGTEIIGLNMIQTDHIKGWMEVLQAEMQTLINMDPRSAMEYALAAILDHISGPLQKVEKQKGVKIYGPDGAGSGEPFEL